MSQIYALDVPESRKMCGRQEDGIGMEAWGGAASASEGAGTSWGALACSAQRTGGGSASASEKLLLMIVAKAKVWKRHRLSDSSAGETPTNRATSPGNKVGVDGNGVVGRGLARALTGR